MSCGDQNCTVKCPKDLTQKIFVKDKQNCRLLFTLGKIGKALWKESVPGDVLSSYNPLFDPNLKNFFRRRGVRDHLLKSNIVNDKNEILCSLKEFNEYRQSLFRVNADHQRVKNKAEDSTEILQKRLETSDKVYQMIESRNKKFYETYGEDTKNSKRCLISNPLKYEVLVKNLKRKKLEKECQQHKKHLEAIRKYNERIKIIEEMNHLKKNEILERGLYRNMEIIKKQIYAAKKRRDFEAKTNKKLSKKFQDLEERRKFLKKPENRTIIIKCPEIF